MRKKQHEAIDMVSPAKTGEVIYDPVQMSRLLRFIVQRLRGIVFIGCLVVAVVASSVVTSFFVGQQQDNKQDRTVARLEQALSNIVAVRTESRVTACEGQRTDQLAINGGIQGTKDLVRTVFAGFDSPKAQEASITLQSNLEATKIPESKIRVCTPQGLAAYYGEPPPKP